MVSNASGMASRREVLRTGIGLSAPFSLLSGISSAQSPSMVEIPAYLHNGEPVQFMEVEAAWKAYSDKVNRVRKRIERQYLADKDVFKIEETVGEEKIPATAVRKPEITVYGERSANLNRLSNLIPTNVEGVKISQRPFPGFRPTAFDGTYEPAIGGIETDFSDSTFTATCSVTHNGGTRFLLARHPFISSLDDADPKRCETTFRADGDYCFQGDDVFGKTYADWQEHDVTVIEKGLLSEKEEFSNKIVSESGEIKGTISSSRLDYLKDNNYTYTNVIRKRGIATVKRRGKVLGTHGTLYCTGEGQNMAEIIRTSNLQYPGDSGGPRYERFSTAPDEYSLYIAGPATQANNNSESLGVAAWYLNQQTGMIFG